MTEVHPSHYIDVTEEMARLRREIGELKTAKSTLQSELEALQNRTPEDALLDAATAFLEEEGAEVMVIGGIRMLHEPGARQYNWQLIINFTGIPPQIKEETNTQ